MTTYAYRCVYCNGEDEISFPMGEAPGEIVADLTDGCPGDGDGQSLLRRVFTPPAIRVH